jgi:hypothetical protein
VLAASLSDAEARSPHRSTLPLLDYWRNPERALASLVPVIGAARPVRLEFEHQTQASGMGKGSHTDLMVTTASVAAAFEAKSTESRYQTVSRWLRGKNGGPASANRTAVLDGWIRLISQATGVPIQVANIESLPYQLIHRAAAACAMRASHRVLAYHIFGDLKPHYRQDLKAFATVAGRTSSLSLWLCHTPFSSHPAHQKLADQWSRGERDLSAPVRAALLTGPLFEFAETSCTRVTADV